jgi:DNA (cytosine-5)-methyltransferase 1
MSLQGDALELLNRMRLDNVAAIHASPPCQGETVLQYVNDNRDAHPRLIEQTREALEATGKPYVIENVVGAKLNDPVTLCGEMFGLGVIRHRLFETNWELPQPKHVKHRGRVRGWRHGKFYDGPYVAVYGSGGGKATLAEASEAMGIDWMDMHGITESIPPAYTEFIGKQLRGVVAA